MGYPKLVVNKENLIKNVKEIIRICNAEEIEVCGVTKCYGGILDVEKVYIEGGIKTIGHARVDNFKEMKNLDVKKLLLRIPSISEVEDVIEYTDISLNSEIKTIRELSKTAISKGVVHDIILMVDLGDLREGILKNDLDEYVKNILLLKGVNLKGIGVNLTCFGGVIPTDENLGELVELSERVEKDFSIKLDIISGGNSSSIYKVLDGTINKKINSLRIGEGIIFGTEASYKQRIPNTSAEVLSLELEVIELKEKGSMPKGEIGLSAFGETVNYKDIGKIKRCIVKCGRQDIDLEDLKPMDENIKIIGGSSDHTILDVSNYKKNLEIGGIIKFRITYKGLLALGTSKYVFKEVK